MCLALERVVWLCDYCSGPTCSVTQSSLNRLCKSETCIKEHVSCSGVVNQVAIIHLMILMFVSDLIISQ